MRLEVIEWLSAGREGEGLRALGWVAMNGFHVFPIFLACHRTIRRSERVLKRAVLLWTNEYSIFRRNYISENMI